MSSSESWTSITDGAGVHGEDGGGSTAFAVTAFAAPDPSAERGDDAAGVGGVLPFGNGGGGTRVTLGGGLRVRHFLKPASLHESQGSE